VEELLAEFDQSLSTYIDTSLISRYNQGDTGLEPDLYFETCYRCAQEVHRATGGAFDITVAPLVNAWGFGFTERADVDSALIQHLLGDVGMEKTSIEDGELKKQKKGVMLDMNAIAQGYAVDVLSEFLESEGISDYLVEIGGEVRTLGNNPRGTGWRIGIDKPVEGLQIPGAALEAVVEISGRSLATSGNYRRFYEKDGLKYSHTINPKTGYPVSHGLLSATVLADDCMHADAYATAFMVMGYPRTVEFLEQNPGMEAFLIYNDGSGAYRTWYTNGMRKMLMEGY
jgi:thiamine biosynthesis lipoprotein